MHKPTADSILNSEYTKMGILMLINLFIASAAIILITLHILFDVVTLSFIQTAIIFVIDYAIMQLAQSNNVHIKDLCVNIIAYKLKKADLKPPASWSN